MALLSQMRNSMPVVLWLLIFSFVALIVFEWGMGFYGGMIYGTTNEVGVVNNKPITREEFSTMVENLTENYRQQTQQEPSAIIENAIREQAWEILVNRVLKSDLMNEAGIKVTDQELYDWVTSDNPPDFIKQQFTDEKGVLNRSALEQAMAAPENREIWLNIEQLLRSQRKDEKFNFLVKNSQVVSPSEVKNRFREENERVSVNYVMVDPNTIPDSVINVTDADIEAYYQKNIEDYSKPESRRIQFVRFSLMPTREDSALVAADVRQLAENFRINTNDSAFVSRYSEKPYTIAWFKRGELSNAKEIIFDQAKGAVTEVLDTDGFYIMKLVDTRPTENELYRARHILIRADEKDQNAVSQALTEIRSIRRDILNSTLPLEEAFIEAAKEKSGDGSARNGGDLGWFGDGKMVKPFEDATKDLRKGQMSQPVKTQFGYHLIYLVDKDNKEYQVTEVYRQMSASGTTTRKAMTSAEDFVFLATEEGFEKEANTRGVNIAQTPLFERTDDIPGLPANSITVNNWAFNAKMNDVSDPIEVEDAMIVAQLTEISPEGYRPLNDQLKQALRREVLKEKKEEAAFQRAVQLRNEIKGDLLAAGGIDARFGMKTTNEFSFTSSPTGVGNDPAFVGASFRLKEGEISEPVIGSKGVYLLELKSRKEAEAAKFETAKSRINRMLLSSTKNAVSQNFEKGLKETADIVDNRNLIYGN